jgi:hypothetical protein
MCTPVHGGFVERGEFSGLLSWDSGKSCLGFPWPRSLDRRARATRGRARGKWRRVFYLSRRRKSRPIFWWMPQRPFFRICRVLRNLGNFSSSRINHDRRKINLKKRTQYTPQHINISSLSSPFSLVRLQACLQVPQRRLESSPTTTPALCRFVRSKSLGIL